MSGLNLFGLVLLGLGGILLIGTVRGIVRRRSLLNNAARVKGRIVHIRHVAANSGDSYDPGRFFPTVQYTVLRQMYERELPPSGDPDKWKNGAVIRLVYDRGNPVNVVDAELRYADLNIALIGSLLVLGIGALLFFFVESPPAE
jgi:hypothetical protein